MLALFRKANFCPTTANAQDCSVSYTITVNPRLKAPYFVLTAGRLPTAKETVSNSSMFKVCKKDGHSPGVDTCDHYTVPLPKVVSFAGDYDTLSNFPPAK